MEDTGMSIWHWTKGTLNGEVSIVNGLYRYSIWETAFGMRQCLAMESKNTLVAAKQECIEIMDGVKE